MPSDGDDDDDEDDACGMVALEAVMGQKRDD